MAHVIDATLRFVDKFTKPMGNAMGSLNKSANQYIKAGKQIEKAGKSIARTGSTLSKGITIPVIGLGVTAVKTAADFESAMSKVQSICGASGSELEKLTEKAKEMGAKTKFSASESADAFAYMAMAGWDTQQMLDGIEGIMYLAGATGEDLAATSDIVTDALTAFGMKASETERFVNVLAQTANKSNTDVAMLGESFQYIAPAAGAMGYCVEDTAVALGLMANSGIKASVAGTALRSMLTNLAKPTDSVEVAMKKLGISLTDTNGEMKPLNKLMCEMRGSFSGLSEAQKAQYAATLAGKTGMSGLLAIVNASDGDFDKLTQAMYNSTGAAKAMYDVANDNLNGRLTTLKSTMESIAITFGERLLPYVEKGVSKLQQLADAFNGLSDEQVDNIIKWAGIAAAIGPIIFIFGKIVTVIGVVITSVGRVGKAISRAGGIMALLKTPAAIAVGAVAAIAVAALLIIKNWDKVKPVLIKVKDAFVTAMIPVKNAVVGAFNKMKPTIDVVVNSFKAVLPHAIKMVKTAFESAKKVFGTFVNTVKPIGAILGKAFSKMAKSMSPGISVIGSVIQKIAPIISKKLGKAFDTAGKIIKKVTPFLQKIASVIGGVLVYAAQKVAPIIEKMGTVFSTVVGVMFERAKTNIGNISVVMGKIITFLKPVIDFMKNVFGKGFKNAFDTVSKIFNSFIDSVKGIIDGVTTMFNGVLDFIMGVFTGNWRMAWEGVKSIFGGIFNSLVELVKIPMNAVIGLINGAINGINSLGLTIPDWVPGLGGQTFSINIPTIPMLYQGTENWKGGTAMVHDRGAEIIDLPSGTRVIPHDKSLQEAKKMGTKTTSVKIAKLADQIVVKEEADIDKIADKLAKKFEEVVNNKGVA